jgi:hypothetical protein
LKYSLEELPGGAGGPVVTRVENGSAIQCVPRVVAGHPWQLRIERCKQVVHSPADDGVIVHPHINVHQAYCVADTCIKETALVDRQTDRQTKVVYEKLNV